MTYTSSLWLVADIFLIHELCFKIGMHGAPYMHLGLSREKEDIVPGPRNLQFP